MFKDHADLLMRVKTKIAVGNENGSRIQDCPQNKLFLLNHQDGDAALNIIRQCFSQTCPEQTQADCITERTASVMTKISMKILGVMPDPVFFDVMNRIKEVFDSAVDRRMKAGKLEDKLFKHINPRHKRYLAELSYWMMTYLVTIWSETKTFEFTMNKDEPNQKTKRGWKFNSAQWNAVLQHETVTNALLRIHVFDPPDHSLFGLDDSKSTEMNPPRDDDSLNLNVDSNPRNAHSANSMQQQHKSAMRNDKEENDDDEMAEVSIQSAMQLLREREQKQNTMDLTTNDGAKEASRVANQLQYIGGCDYPFFPPNKAQEVALIATSLGAAYSKSKMKQEIAKSVSANPANWSSSQLTMVEAVITDPNRGPKGLITILDKIIGSIKKRVVSAPLTPQNQIIVNYHQSAGLSEKRKEKSNPRFMTDESDAKEREKLYRHLAPQNSVSHQFLDRAALATCTTLKDVVLEGQNELAGQDALQKKDRDFEAVMNS